MFDIGFSEMMIVGVVALVVLGPEKLPRVARQAGQWIGKLQRYVADVKTDLNRQIELEELRRVQSELQSAAQEFKADVEGVVNQAQSQLDDITEQARSIGAPEAAAAAPEPVTDWDRVYAVRRTRERIKDRRKERQKELALMRRLR